MTRRKRAWLLTILTFLVCLPPAFFIGITLIGHARLLPYVSVWLDRLVLVITALGLPLLAALGIYRLVSHKGVGTDGLSTVLEHSFLGKAQEARTILARYGTEAHEREPDRVRLAVIELSGGDLAELSRLVDLAKQDWRDVLMWAEKQRQRAGQP